MVDLFSGTGAFSKAFNDTSKVNVVLANDFSPDSEKIYTKNFNHKYLLKDINEVETSSIPSHDILTAGFPCQPFSIAGKQEGFNDTRANVFWKIVDIVKCYKPRIVVLENVKNLKNHDNGNTYEVISSSITNMKYKIKYCILNTSKVTKVPQNRERIYIVCFREKEDYEKFSFDFTEEKPSKIKDFLEENVPDKYYYKNTLKVWSEIEKSVVKNIDTDTVYQYRRYYVRENKNSLCPTLTANMGGGGHNVPLIKDNIGIRKLTPRECFNLQGFDTTYQLPDNMSDSSLYKLAGNAVTLSVVKLIANKLMEIIV